jgi:hypothetical protein
MPAYKLHHNTATNDERNALCSNLVREVIGEAEYGPRTMKISDQALIEFGWAVGQEEAHYQRRAYE